MRIPRLWLASLLTVATAAGAYAQAGLGQRVLSANGSVDVLLSPTRALIAITTSSEGIDAHAAAVAADSLRAVLAPVLGGHSLELIPFAAGYGENQAVRRMVSSQMMEVRTPRDYLAKQGFVVEVSDPGRVDAVVRDLAAAFRGPVPGISISYFADEADPRITDAFTQATRLALERADAMARAAGGVRGDLVSMQISPNFGQPQMLRVQYQPDGSGISIPPSEILMRVTVSGTWRFGTPE